MVGPGPGETRESDPLRRVRACGRIMVNGQSASVEVERDLGDARYGGLAVCGSIHACPVCSASIRHQRAEDIERAAETHLGNGGHVAMVTLTTSHSQGMALAGLWDTVSKGLRYLRSGRKAKALNDQLGLVGTIRAVEVTVGRNGWHPHVHLLLFMDGGDSIEEQVRAIERVWAERWSMGIVRQGYPAPRQPYGVRVQAVGLAAVGTYLAKVQDGFGGSWGPGLEIARADLKRSLDGEGRTPFVVLEDYLRDGQPQDLAIWREWETASKGRRAIVWSNGLRDRLGLDEEVSDQEAAEGSAWETDTVYVLCVEEWMAVLSARKQYEVLEAAERGRTEAVRGLLAGLLEVEPTDLGCDECEWSEDGYRMQACGGCRARMTRALQGARRKETGDG